MIHLQPHRPDCLGDFWCRDDACYWDRLAATLTARERLHTAGRLVSAAPGRTPSAWNPLEAPASPTICFTRQRRMRIAADLERLLADLEASWSQCAASSLAVTVG